MFSRQRYGGARRLQYGIACGDDRMSVRVGMLRLLAIWNEVQIDKPEWLMRDNRNVFGSGVGR